MIHLSGSSLYERSVRSKDGCEFGMARIGTERVFLIGGSKEELKRLPFSGIMESGANGPVLRCELSDANAEALRSVFVFTRPVLIGKDSSFGFGDRLGDAGPAHLRSLDGSSMRPVLAQQSIRELERTNRRPIDVMNAASWAVFQEGYTSGFGADGDHLKTPEHIDRMMRAGFTMLTIDPSEHVVDVAHTMSSADLETAFLLLPWDELDTTPEATMRRYVDRVIHISDGIRITPSRMDLLKGMVTYGRVLAHTRMMSTHIRTNWRTHPTELELSVDETDHPTTPFEHLLIASELQRMDVELVSLAPRFSGDFEKGVDFRGDITQFTRDYIVHRAIAKTYGDYKLSIHSGSDKFTIYQVIGSIGSDRVHVKTAGTSYLEALRTIATIDPDLFSTILQTSISQFAVDRKTYHVSADVSRVRGSSPELLDSDDARQILHVTFGSILTHPELHPRIQHALAQNESTYEEHLVRHFKKHLHYFA